MLTTQLKNQNPLEPLDTNQFTQQLVQFAGVEQQMKMNTQMASLIAIEQTAQSTAAMAYLGSTATVDGATAKLDGRQRDLDVQFAEDLERHDQHQECDRRDGLYRQLHGQRRAAELPVGRQGNNGTQWPDGSYTLSITAKDAAGQTVAISTEVSGTVDSVDLSTSPPTLSIGGQKFTADKIKRVVRPGA